MWSIGEAIHATVVIDYIKQPSKLYAMYWFRPTALDKTVLRNSLESERDELPRRSQRREISQALLSFHLISFMSFPLYSPAGLFTLIDAGGIFSRQVR